MVRSHFVSGYVPLSRHPRSNAEFATLGAKLQAVPVDKTIYLTDTLADCWLHQWLDERGREGLTYSDSDSAKDTIDYHIVNHQKTQWMVRAAEENPAAEVIVWLDYGIMRIHGFTDVSVVEFANNLRNTREIAIPGMWPKEPCTGDGIRWRFCGGVVVAHRDVLPAFHEAVQAQIKSHIESTKNVCYEVNTWARVEWNRPDLPIRWYGADHNGSLLSSY